MQWSLSCGNIWRRKRSRVQPGILHEPLWRQLSNSNSSEVSEPGGRPVTDRKHCAGGRVCNSARPFPRTGEIAIFANFTKSTGSFPPFFFCPFNLLRMVRLLHLELLRETLRTVSNRRLDHVVGSQKGVQ
jgi:hypothetical protein